MEKEYSNSEKKFMTVEDNELKEMNEDKNSEVETHNCTNVLHNQFLRNISSYFLPPHAPHYRWIFNKINKLVHELNGRKYNFDIDGLIEPVQLTKYSNNGFYSDHIDLGNTYPESDRKLSFTIQLSDSENYDGGNVILKTSHIKNQISKGLGSITFWPSFMLHNVEPITKGNRWSLCGWISGKQFK